MALRLADKPASLTAAEKIAKELGVEAQTGLYEGGSTVRIGRQTFPVHEIEDIAKRDPKTFRAIVRKALGV